MELPEFERYVLRPGDFDKEADCVDAIYQAVPTYLRQEDEDHSPTIHVSQ